MKKLIYILGLGLTLALSSTAANALCAWHVAWPIPIAQTVMITNSCPDVKGGTYNNRTKAYSDALFTWVHLNTDTQRAAGGSVHTNAVWGIPLFHNCEIRGYYQKRNGSYKEGAKKRHFCP